MGIAIGIVLAACGSPATSTTGAPATTGSGPTTSTGEPVVTVDPTTTVTDPPAGACPDLLTSTQATVVGVQDWVRIRLEPTTASDEIGRFDAGATVTAFPDTLGYDGTDYWWVTVQIPASGSCGSVAAGYLANQAGPLDQQIPGLAFVAPPGTWTYGDRTSLRDPIVASLAGAFSTTYSVRVFDGLLIDPLLDDQLAEFQDLAYDYPPDWYREVTVTGADRAVRIVPVVSESGDLAINRLLVEIGGVTVEASTTVYIEDLDLVPGDALGAFLDSVAFDPGTFMEAVS